MIYQLIFLLIELRERESGVSVARLGRESLGGMTLTYKPGEDRADSVFDLHVKLVADACGDSGSNIASKSNN